MEPVRYRRCNYVSPFLFQLLSSSNILMNPSELPTKKSSADDADGSVTPRVSREGGGGDMGGGFAVAESSSAGIVVVERSSGGDHEFVEGSSGGGHEFVEGSSGGRVAPHSSGTGFGDFVGRSSVQGTGGRLSSSTPRRIRYTPGMYGPELPHRSAHAVPPRYGGRHSTDVSIPRAVSPQPSMAQPFPAILSPGPLRTVMTGRRGPPGNPRYVAPPSHSKTKKKSLAEKADHAFSSLIYPSLPSDQPLPSTLDERIQDAFSASYSKTKSPTFFIENAGDSDRSQVFSGLGPCLQCSASSQSNCVLLADDTMCTTCRGKYDSAKKSCSHKRIVHFRQFHLLAHLPPFVAFRLLETLMPSILRNGFQLTEEQWHDYRESLRRLPFFQTRLRDLGLPGSGSTPSRSVRQQMDFVLVPPVPHYILSPSTRTPPPSTRTPPPSSPIVVDDPVEDMVIPGSSNASEHEATFPSVVRTDVPVHPAEVSPESGVPLPVRPTALRHLRETEQAMLRIEGFRHFREDSVRSLAAAIEEGTLKAVEQQLVGSLILCQLLSFLMSLLQFDESSSHDAIDPTLALAPFSRELLDVYRRENTLVLRQQQQLISNQETNQSQVSQLGRLQGIVDTLSRKNRKLSTNLRRVKDEFRSSKVKSGMVNVLSIPNSDASDLYLQHIISLTEEVQELRGRNSVLQDQMAQFNAVQSGDEETVAALRLQLIEANKASTSFQDELRVLRSREREVREFATRFLAPPSVAVDSSDPTHDDSNKDNVP